MQPLHVELLAPAGSIAALHAAVCAGADAVYLGLDHFNARRGADNFTMPAFKEACDYAHLRGVRVYVTLNTLILPHEIKEVMEYARQSWRAGADAFIVQDIGLAHELRRTLPEARLHISTQMNTHNVAGIAAAAQLDAQRVTLARELSLEEIEHMVDAAQQVGLEVEAFAHGAICICYSGQCLMSSMIGGRSANRGTCAQACRLPYELRNKSSNRTLPAQGEHLLSPQDLCSINILPKLIATGVRSLKIEGRMKSPEYVYTVTSIYRSVLDKIAQRAVDEGITDVLDIARLDVAATADEMRELAEAFSRGFTTGYLEHDRGNSMMSYQRPNNRGVNIGRIERINDASFTIDAREQIAIGDVVEVWTSAGRATFTLRADFLQKDGTFLIAIDKSNKDHRSIHKGDRVFRVRNAASMFDDKVFEPRIAVDGRVILHLGEPLIMEFWPVVHKNPAALACKGIAVGDALEPARTKPLAAEDVYAHIDRLGQTPYEIRHLDIDLEDGVGLGFSTLHQIRAAALDDLSGQLRGFTGERVLEKIDEYKQPRAVNHTAPLIAAYVTNPACARAAKRAGADVIYVGALHYKRGYAMVAGVMSPEADTAGYPKGTALVMPTVDHDLIESNRESERGIDVWESVTEGKTIIADSWSSVIRALNDGAQVEVGTHLPVTNKFTIDYLADLGVTRVWLSPELTLKQIKELSEDGLPVGLGLTIIGTQELMVTEHCMLMSQGNCAEDCAQCPRRKSPHYLHDRKGFDFPVTTDALGRSHVYNSVLFDVAHALPELIEAGIDAFMVDTTLMNVEETAQAVGRAVHARDIALTGDNTVPKVNAATTGHLFRGIQ